GDLRPGQPVQEQHRLALPTHVRRDHHATGVDLDLVQVRGTPGPPERAEQCLHAHREVEVAGDREAAVQEGLPAGDEALVDGEPRLGLGGHNRLRGDARALTNEARVVHDGYGEGLWAHAQLPFGRKAVDRVGTEAPGQA